MLRAVINVVEYLLSFLQEQQPAGEETRRAPSLHLCTRLKRGTKVVVVGVVGPREPWRTPPGDQHGVVWA